jgi:hypothetical protein
MKYDWEFWTHITQFHRACAIICLCTCAMAQVISTTFFNLDAFVTYGYVLNFVESMQFNDLCSGLA